MSEGSKETEPLMNTNALKRLVKEAMRELIDEGKLDANLDETARKLAEIKAKPFITIPEAVLLYRCSDSHLYKQIKLAREGKTDNPIPFMDVGTYVLPHEDFLNWERSRREGENQKVQTAEAA
jgi:hypothetical protein